MVEKGVPPSSDADGALESVGSLEKAFEDEGSNMDGFFSTGFDSGDGGSFGFGEVGHPSEGAGDLLVVEDLSVDEFGFPGGEFFSDGDEVCSGCAECDHGSTGVGSVAESDGVIDRCYRVKDLEWG